VVPRTAQVARAPRGIRLEAAAGEHDGTGGEIAESRGALHSDTGHAARPILEEPHRSRAVADLDAMSGGDVEPHLREADAFVLGPDHRPGRPLDGVAHLDAGQRHRGFHDDALLRHPAHGVIGARDQELGQLGIGAILGDAAEIGPEEIARVSLHAEHEAGHLLLDVGHDGQEVFRTVEGEAEEAAAVVGIAAPQGLGSLLQHQHASRPGFAGRHRGGEGCIAGTNHDHVMHGSST
jgi:hypothetical protein